MSVPLPAIVTRPVIRRWPGSDGRAPARPWITSALFATGLVASALAGLPARAMAQIGILRPGAGAGASFEVYRFADADAFGIQSLSLLTVPFAGRADLSGRATLTISGAWARGQLNASSGDQRTVAGLTDTEVRATVGTDAVRFTAIALLPTGHSTLGADEADVAGAVAADLLPFRISNWGTGGGFGGSVAVARSFGNASAGVSVGYVLTREFEPVDDQSDFVYRPGNQLHVTAALDAGFGTAGKGALRLSFQRFDTDLANDANLYQAGNRIQASASYSFAAGPRASAILFAGLHHRDEGEFQASTRITPALDIVMAGIGVRLPAGRGVLQPSLELRVTSGTDDASTGYSAGIGATAEWPAGPATFAPTLRLRTGKASTVADAVSTWTGAELGFAIRFGTR